MFPRSVRGALGPDEVATMTTVVTAKAPIAVQNHQRSKMDGSGEADDGGVPPGSVATAGGGTAGAGDDGAAAAGSGSTGAAGGGAGDVPDVCACAGGAITSAVARPKMVSAVAHR